MCGIFGAVGDGSEEVARSAIAALQHRGPDAQGIWVDPSGDVALGHTRLKVIDLTEAGAQPMPGCDATVQVVFNGEIYNHHGLQRELEALGHRFRSRADTEVIVHGYEQWGAGVVERLDGMFALGVWDGRARRLLLARDRAGKKPLFYALSPDGRALRFASEVKALIAAGHPDFLDETALPMLLSFGYVPGAGTVHKDVRRLPVACRLLFSPGHGGPPRPPRPPQIDEYWRPTFLDPPLPIGGSAGRAEARARVRELVVAAVERRLESDVPLGAFLSGGLDSSVIVGVMARLFGRRVQTFSIGFAGDPAYDETGYAREAARAFGTEHTEFFVAPPSVDLLRRLVWLHDGPFADSSAVPTYTVAELTRQHVTVALSGDGGDELFAGYLRFLAAEAAERLPGGLRRGMSMVGRLLPRSLPERSLGGQARRFLAGASLPLPDRISSWGQLFADRLVETLRPELRARLDLGTPHDYQQRFFADQPGPRGGGGGDGGGPTPLARLLDHNFRTYLAYDLNPKVDRCSAGVALEVRSPFLDTALVEYVGRLPDDLKRRGRETKVILREAFADLVPESILRRGKMGFGIPLAAWLRGPLRGLVEDLLGPRALLAGYLEPTVVERMTRDHLAGRADHGHRLWLLLTLELWLRSLSAGGR